MTFHRLLLALPLLVACGGHGLEQPGGSDLGPTGCAAHTTFKACAADGACEPASCATCSTEPELLGCYDKGAAPVVTCPVYDCAFNCDRYEDEASCDADPSCAPIYVDDARADCAGDCTLFSRCGNAGTTCYAEIPPENACFTTVECGTGYYFVVEGGCATGCLRAADCSQAGE